MSSIIPLPQTGWVIFEQTCYEQFPEKELLDEEGRLGGVGFLGFQP